VAAEGSNGDEGVEGDVGDDGDDGPEPGQSYSGDHGAVIASGPEGIEGADGISGADGELAKYVVSTYPGHVGAEYGIQSHVLHGGGYVKPVVSKESAAISRRFSSCSLDSTGDDCRRRLLLRARSALVAKKSLNRRD
jgi:hypothetical protein